MASKTSIEVLIAGKVYTLSGYESEEYLQKVASYINGKIAEFSKIEGYNRMAFDMKAALLNLNIADDYFKVRTQAQNIENTIEDKEKEIYELKHELISIQIKIEEYQSKIKELEAENKELILNKARLETSLEDALFSKKAQSSKQNLEHDRFNNSKNPKRLNNASRRL